MANSPFALDRATAIRLPVQDFPSQASDVYSWAKQPNKPTYTASEVGALPADTELHTHSNKSVLDKKAITGQTPNDFILTIRLKKGALMLRNNPELNITENFSHILPG